VNALSKPEVGAYINRHFVSSFQKVATFRIVNGQKQGGNVAAYFCAPDGRVLHCVAGPVDAATMLREATWVVENARKAIEESKRTETPFKVLFRRWHAERLRKEHGILVEAATVDTVPDEDDPLQARDPSGRPIVPVLPPPPIDGPDVSFRQRAAMDAEAAGAPALKDKAGRGVALGNQGRVHHLMAAYSMVKIERIYGTVFHNILGERVSTQPVITIGGRDERRAAPCLHCESKAAVDIRR
jgi:hypothetical protein